MTRPLLSALGAAVGLVLVLLLAVVTGQFDDGEPAVPPVTDNAIFKVVAPCPDPLVFVPGLAEPFHPGGADFSVGAGRGTLVVVCQ